MSNLYVPTLQLHWLPYLRVTCTALVKRIPAFFELAKQVPDKQEKAHKVFLLGHIYTGITVSRLVVDSVVVDSVVVDSVVMLVR